MPSGGRIDPYLRSGTMPGKVAFITRDTLEAVERIIADNKNSVRKAHEGMDLLVRLLILIVKAEVQKRSMGPVSPTRRSRPELANRIPVQRITGDYFAGWHIQRVGNAHWRIYNDTVEAYLIETGLFQRTRRPILKMSVIAMLRFVQTTKVADRFMSWVLAPRRNEKGQFQSFKSRLAGSSAVGNGMGYADIYGHKSGRHMVVTRHAAAGPQGRLPG